nr:hypothetical protein HmN_000895600 [Hymenolepis microstoma]
MMPLVAVKPLAANLVYTARTSYILSSQLHSQLNGLRQPLLTVVFVQKTMLASIVMKGLVSRPMKDASIVPKTICIITNSTTKVMSMTLSLVTVAPSPQKISQDTVHIGDSLIPLEMQKPS